MTSPRVSAATWPHPHPWVVCVYSNWGGLTSLVSSSRRCVITLVQAVSVVCTLVSNQPLTGLCIEGSIQSFSHCQLCTLTAQTALLGWVKSVTISIYPSLLVQIPVNVFVSLLPVKLSNKLMEIIPGLPRLWKYPPACQFATAHLFASRKSPNHVPFFLYVWQMCNTYIHYMCIVLRLCAVLLLLYGWDRSTFSLFLSPQPGLPR